ncbi:MAG TPA: RAD55 family ATPase [Nitrososphaerales archaeon]|nr:RAD55 family ATPase [Nitrososphaerales archaeon]
MNSLSQAVDALTFSESLPDGLTILSGESGCGKTIFCQQFAHEALEKGSRVLWITTEELPSNLRAGMERFGWGTSKYDSLGKLTILDAVSPARLGLSENIGRGTLGLDPTGMLIVLSEQLRSADSAPNGGPGSSSGSGGIGKLLLIFDSISRLLLSCDSKSVIDFVSCLSSRMENYRIKGFATISEGAHDERTLNALRFSCAGTIRFRVKEQGDERVRQLRLETMRGRKHMDSWKSYAITDHGLEVRV